MCEEIENSYLFSHLAIIKKFIIVHYVPESVEGLEQVARRVGDGQDLPQQRGPRPEPKFVLADFQFSFS